MQSQILRLLGLPDNRARLQSEEFQDWVQRSKSWTAWYKRKYNLAITDDRFTEATLSEILLDAMLDDAYHFAEQFNKWDPDTNELAVRMELDPKTAVTEEREKLAELLNRIHGRS